MIMATYVSCVVQVVFGTSDLFVFFSKICYEYSLGISLTYICADRVKIFMCLNIYYNLQAFLVVILKMYIEDIVK